MGNTRRVEAPEPWRPIDYLCYPGAGSKAYKHPTGANAHIIDMHGTGNYIAQIEDEGGDFEEVRGVPYPRAVEVVSQWMRERPVDTDTDHSDAEPDGDSE
jgi:hypothetical protein